MLLLEVLLFLLLCALALGWASRRFGLPYPIALVVGGGLLGFIPRLPQLDFDPQFLLVLVLPPILYQAALLTSWRDFKASLRTISLLAIGLVLATTLVVGAALKALIPEIPWAAAFVFGAIVSPPDAVAATAILSRLNMPRRIVTVLEGESLVNDASGLVLYKLAVAVWNILVFMLNSLIFILIGLQLSGIVARLQGYTGRDLAAYALAISMIAILVRFAWVYFAEYLPAWLGRLFDRRVAPPLPGEAFIAGWCGMRGILSLAAALALPVETPEGGAFPYRDLIIFLTFAVIAVTLVVQSLTLAPLIGRLKLGSDPGARAEQRKARLSMGRAALAAIEQHAAGDGVPSELADRIGAEFGDRMAAASPLAQQPDSIPALAKRLRLAAVRAERDELIRMWRNAEVSDDVLHHLEEELDYEESRL